MYFFAGGTNERRGTDHVTSGPMRGLEKKCTRRRKQTDKQTHRHGESMTELAQWGRFRENPLECFHFKKEGNSKRFMQDVE